MAQWRQEQEAREARIAAGAPLADGKVVPAGRAGALLEAVLRPGDRVCLEGDNQKQADLLARALAGLDPDKVHDLHMVQSGVVLPEHLDIFETGIARRLDFAYSGPQSARIARMLYGGQIALGAVHTYLELFARYFIDLTPHVALIAAVSADREGNLYTGPNTEDTPAIVDGIVIESSATKSMTVPPTGALARNAASETTATETGLAMMPIWAPIDAAAIGRSGRMLFLMAMS